MSGEPPEFKWTRKSHDIRQAAKRFLEGDESMTHQPADGESGSCTCDQCGVVLMSCDIGATCRFCGRRAVAALAAAAEKLREKDEELKRLGERLAAAERFRFGSCLFSCSNNGWECYRLSDGSYLGDPPHSNTFIFKTFDDAYLAAVAANWLPQPEQQGGG